MPEETKPTRRRKKEVPPKSRGLHAGRLAGVSPPASASQLAREIEADGGSVLAIYKDPLGGHWHVFAGLPIDKVEPTPFQRDLSANHVKRLAAAIDKIDRFLDPIVAVRSAGLYWTPNGHHRTAAMKKLGARSIVAMVTADEELAYQILALNTEKAHNLRERSLEVARMAQALSDLDPRRPERDFETEFEEAALITLGLCYQQNGRFAGSAYHSVLKKIDRFLGTPLPDALAVRADRAAQLVELEEVVNEAVRALKAKGLESPYLKTFVVARINPLRFQRGVEAEFDETVAKMLTAARKFDPEKIRADQVTRAGS